MDAILNDRADLSYSDIPPVIVAATSEAAMRRGLNTIEAAGLRVADRVLVPSAIERIEKQVSTTAIWIELDEDCGGSMDELLGLISRDVADGRYAAIVSTCGGLIDPVMAGLHSGSVEVVVDADEAERAAALAIATSRAALPLRLSDVAADKGAARLRQLSDEVSRIAATLARLSTGPVAAPPTEAAPAGDLPPLSAETVRAVIQARRLRSRYFSEELFADPAWDMLLDLLQAEIAHLRVPVSSLCIAAAVPATTALRWL
jgi:hypothetical protein